MEKHHEVISRNAFRLSRNLSRETLNAIIKTIQKYETQDLFERKTEVIALSHTPSGRKIISEALDELERSPSPATPENLACALSTAIYAEKYHNETQFLDLVWTGCETRSFRRTEQALLEVIQSSEHDLLIVSFVVYKIPHIVEALKEAYKRNVDVAILLEAPDAGAGKIELDTIHTLGNEIVENTKIYIWPVEKRLKDRSGNPGTLHIKCALADKRMLLISSANLTGHALNINMELGILVKGGALPESAHNHFQRLIQDGTFKLI